MSREGPVRKNDKGMTLVEVLVSMVIVFIFFLGINAGGIIVLDANIQNSQRDEAVSVGEEALMQMRNIAYNDLPALDNTANVVVRQIRGTRKNYTIRRTVNPVGDITELRVTVVWERVDRKRVTHEHSHVLNTIVRR